MANIENIYEHPFTIEILGDAKGYGLFKSRENEYADTEQEYCINNSNFYLVHLIMLDQLQNALKLFLNYIYNKKYDVGGGKHLVYNYENYNWNRFRV